ncbi:MAG: HAD family hydrolase [Chloroflexi bacterium]|nr:HAD family hydrolase [Chloroflexota bacterium]
MIHALIFDFDGTILDTETPEFYIWQQIYRDHGTELALQEWVLGVGAIGAFDPYEALQQRAPDLVLNRDELRAYARARHEPVIHAQAPRDGVVEVLQNARARGLRLAVASSSMHDWVDAHLKRLGLFEYFDIVCCRDDVAPGRAKPHPDIYQAALAALGVRAAEAIAIEDSLNGMRAALAAGIFTVVTPNPVTAQLDFSQADLVLPSLTQLDLDVMSKKSPSS